MGVIVSKFGGSSMADAVMFQKVKKIVSERHSPHYIVLSAPGKRSPDDGKITDLLCLAHRLAASGSRPDIPLLQICRRFSDITEGLGIKTQSDALLNTLADDISVSSDHAASRGEFICAKIFADYTELPFVDAAALVFFDAHGRLDRRKTGDAIRDMRKRLPRAVIPGFYGSMPDGSLRTFSRGGSDITGALIAAALDASIYENWTDTDGLMSADPSLCADAVRHPAVSYRQMRMLADSGAQVLHPRCLDPVRAAGIPTEIRNTFAPDHPGTYISDRVLNDVFCICASEGHRSVSLSSLPEEIRPLFAAVQGRRFVSPEGNAVFPVKDVDFGVPASIVSLFGLQDQDIDAALALASPIAYSVEDACFRILVPAGQTRDVVKALHHRFSGQK